MSTKHHHFLIVIFGSQGQINPARHLARRLARAASARVTITSSLSAHRRLFPSSAAAAGEPDHVAQEPPLNPDGSAVVAYSPYSDGLDEKCRMDEIDPHLFMEKLKLNGSVTLATLARNCASKGIPVTCVLYTNIHTWAADVARDLGIPAVHYWIQAASVFAVYYHYFHRHRSFISSVEEKLDLLEGCYNNTLELPNLPLLRKRDLPSFINTPGAYLSAHMEIFSELEKMEKPVVLVNTFHELEAQAIEGVKGVELLTIGPIVDKYFTQGKVESRDLFEEDTCDYMEWLNAQKEGSVIYVAFGSMTRLSETQIKELNLALEESRWPYLWVHRKDNRAEGEKPEIVSKDKKGIVVEWCSQVRVLDHNAVGCFVTHCGWNSASEAVVSGVPMVMLPQWIDQRTNARLAEEVWGIGLTVEAGEDGVVGAEEVKRCLEAVMGESKSAVDIRRNAEGWKEKARIALLEDGSSCKNLRAFVDSV